MIAIISIIIMIIRTLIYFYPDPFYAWYRHYIITIIIYYYPDHYYLQNITPIIYYPKHYLDMNTLLDNDHSAGDYLLACL